MKSYHAIVIAEQEIKFAAGEAEKKANKVLSSVSSELRDIAREFAKKTGGKIITFNINMLDATTVGDDTSDMICGGCSVYYHK